MGGSASCRRCLSRAMLTISRCGCRRPISASIRARSWQRSVSMLRRLMRYSAIKRRSRARRAELRLDVDDDVILFDRDRIRLGDVGPFEQAFAALDRDGKFPEADIVAIAPGLSGADIVL